ncbi:MAG: hypothetical protein ACOZD0_07880 [Pseudomonadota bacterium]
MVKLPANGWSRFWMTGCTALVLLAAGQMPSAAEEDSSRRHAVTLTSGYPVDETLERIVRQARNQGLAVVARLDAPTSPADAAGRRVLVLGDEAQRTPVLQGQPHNRLALPLQVVVGPAPNGGTQVAVEDAAYWSSQPVVPGEVVERVAALPTLIESALRG